jgi:hypothetical protein
MKETEKQNTKAKMCQCCSTVADAPGKKSECLEAAVRVL